MGILHFNQVKITLKYLIELLRLTAFHQKLCLLNTLKWLRVVCLVDIEDLAFLRIWLFVVWLKRALPLNGL